MFIGKPKMNYRQHSNQSTKVRSQFYSLSLQGLATPPVLSLRLTMNDVKGHTLMIHVGGSEHLICGILP